MKRLRFTLATFTAAFALFASVAHAQEPAAKPAVAEINKVCPVSGKPADPKITTAYEGITYAFADEASRAKFTADREKSLYHKLGGRPAIDAVVDAFYVKVLADNRINRHFKEINMNRQRRKQKDFLSAAFGGPTPWTGPDMRKAHADLEITEADFSAVAENLQKTMEEMKVPKELIDQVMAIAASTHDAVLNRKPADKK